MRRGDSSRLDGGQIGARGLVLRQWVGGLLIALHLGLTLGAGASSEPGRPSAIPCESSSARRRLALS